MSDQLLVLSLNSLQLMSDEERYSNLVSKASLLRDPASEWDVVEVSAGEIRYFITKRDMSSSRLAVIRTNDLFWSLTMNQRAGLLDRCRRFVEFSSRKPLFLPNTWRFFKYSDLAVFFALPANQVARNPRWVVKYVPNDTILFWDLYGTDGPFRRLEDEEVDSSLEGIVRSHSPQA